MTEKTEPLDPDAVKRMAREYLSPEDAREVRRLHGNGTSALTLSARYRKTYATIQAAIDSKD